MPVSLAVPPTTMMDEEKRLIRSSVPADARLSTIAMSSGTLPELSSTNWSGYSLAWGGGAGLGLLARDTSVSASVAGSTRAGVVGMAGGRKICLTALRMVAICWNGFSAARFRKRKPYSSTATEFQGELLTPLRRPELLGGRPKVKPHDVGRKEGLDRISYRYAA
jgi:hypothetical protein